MALRRSHWEDEIGRMSVGATKAGCPACHWLGISPSGTSLFRPSAVVVRATVVGVACGCRNPSRIEVRDMLSYQLWENALTPALRATYNFPGPPYL